MSETFANEIARQRLTVTAVFVPFSQSRNADKDPKREISKRSLNWKVTLHKDGREILTTDYMAGVAHCPSYKQNARWTLAYAGPIEFETETGRAFREGWENGKAIEPDAMGVIASLAMDAGAIDFGSFEEWASDYGYDADSRAAEGIYRACLGIALKLRSGLGEADLATLRETASEY